MKLTLIALEISDLQSFLFSIYNFLDDVLIKIFYSMQNAISLTMINFVC